MRLSSKPEDLTLFDSTDKLKESIQLNLSYTCHIKLLTSYISITHSGQPRVSGGQQSLSNRVTKG
jgi:hypothetical protein